MTSGLRVKVAFFESVFNDLLAVGILVSVFLVLYSRARGIPLAELWSQLRELFSR